MTDLKNTEGIYFIGIGGIGMSALARYFVRGGFIIAGYDRTGTSITESLSDEGVTITFEDDTDQIPEFFRNISDKGKVLIVFTPAIPKDNRILSFFRENGYIIRKRSEVLGDISARTDTLAVSGTHGKTTVSTMIAHLLKQSDVDCSAFLGGISKNYDSNLLLGAGRYTVMEADEFDRSFHRLQPYMAVVTSVDADHLDIYGDQETMIQAYNEFCTKIRKDGNLLINKKIQDKIIIPEGVNGFTYGMEADADYNAFNIRQEKGCFIFSVKTPGKVIEDLRFEFPGKINIENFTAAIGIALMCGVPEKDIRKAVLLFRGVKRRFDVRFNQGGITYIDDYGHHPEEIRACINAIKEYFSGRRITGIFQPHLYSRTRDHAEGFAEILDRLDEPILLPIYPAREKPIEGVSSEMILERMKSPNKKLMQKQDIPDSLDIKNLDVLLTIGAGDIDTLVKPIEDMLRKAKA